MAVIGVNVRPTHRPEQKQKDKSFTEKALDNVLTAAKIAEVGFGIYTDQEELEIKRKESELKGRTSIQEYEANFAKEFRKDKVAQEIETSYFAADKMSELAKSGKVSQPAYAGIVSNAVQAATGGVPLTDKQIELFAPDPSLANLLKGAYSRYWEGQPTASDVKVYADLAETLKKYNVHMMERRAAYMADTEGRRIGDMDFVVNNILKPRSRLTGVAVTTPYTYKKDTKLEGKELPGQTRVRRTLNTPTANSPQIEKTLKAYEAGELDPLITEERIKRYMEKAKGTVTKGQAIYEIQENIRELQKEKQRRQEQQGLQKRFESREGARQDVRENVLAPLQKQGQ